MAKNYAHIPGAGAWNQYQEAVDGETFGFDPDLIIPEHERELPTTDELKQILYDILEGKPAPDNERESLAEARARMTKDVEEIRARGGIIEFPADIA
jgi:hypothetical protein